MTKKVLISTGGSGGHVIPAITIYNHIKHKHETLITTDIRGLAYLDKDQLEMDAVVEAHLDESSEEEE